MASAIICTPSADITDLCRKVIKGIGVTEIFNFSDAKGCIAKLKTSDKSILMLDFGIGAANAVEVLTSLQTIHPAGLRPIFLFDRKDSPNLSGVALEFGVMQVHVGQMSRDVIEQRVKALLATPIYDEAVRTALETCMNARLRGDVEAEVRVLKTLLESRPDDLTLVCELADTYFKLGDLDAATFLLKAHISPETKNPRVLNIFGRCLMRKGDFDQASVFLQQADFINPYQTDRLIELGEAYIQLDKPSRAQGKFKRALDLDPRNAKASQGMGKSLLLSGDINEALVFLRQISSPAEMASIFNAAAVIAIRNDRMDQGLKLYRVACKTIGASDSAVLSKLALNMGLAHHRLKDLPNALYFFQISAGLDPNFTRAIQGVSNLERKVSEADRLPLGFDLFSSLVNEATIDSIDPKQDGDDIESTENDYVESF